MKTATRYTGCERTVCSETNNLFSEFGVNKLIIDNKLFPHDQRVLFLSGEKGVSFGRWSRSFSEGNINNHLLQIGMRRPLGRGVGGSWRASGPRTISLEKQNHQPIPRDDVVDEARHLEGRLDRPDLFCSVPGLEDCEEPRGLLVRLLGDGRADLRLEGREEAEVERLEDVS